MRVLFDICHPAQVHLFKNLIWRLERECSDVLVVAREKDVALPLMDALGIRYQTISRQGAGLWGLGRELAVRNARLLRIARRFRPHLMIAETGVSIGPVGKLLGIPRLVFEECEIAKLQRTLGLPLASRICTGFGYLGDHGKRHVRFAGFRPLAYLAPDYFTPDPEVLRQAGVDPAAPFFFVRLVSWQALHDNGLHGATRRHLSEIIKRLSPLGRVLITSEAELPEEFRQYENPVPIERLHHLLAFARLCIAEGGTVTTESAVLGTPTICYFPVRLGYLEALQQHGLIHRIASPGEAADEALTLLRNANLASTWQSRRAQMLERSEDVLQFMHRMVQETALPKAA